MSHLCRPSWTKSPRYPRTYRDPSNVHHNRRQLFDASESAVRRKTLAQPGGSGRSAAGACHGARSDGTEQPTKATSRMFEDSCSCDLPWRSLPRAATTPADRTAGFGQDDDGATSPTFLPPLTFEGRFECTAIHSVAGTLPQRVGLLTQRPFRAPHHFERRAGRRRCESAPRRDLGRITACSSLTRCRSSIGARVRSSSWSP